MLKCFRGLYLRTLIKEGEKGREMDGGEGREAEWGGLGVMGSPTLKLWLYATIWNPYRHNPGYAGPNIKARAANVIISQLHDDSYEDTSVRDSFSNFKREAGQEPE